MNTQSRYVELTDLPHDAVIQLAMLLASYRKGMEHETLNFKDAMERGAEAEEIAEIGNRMIALGNQLREQEKALMEPFLPALN